MQCSAFPGMFSCFSFTMLFLAAAASWHLLLVPSSMHSTTVGTAFFPPSTQRYTEKNNTAIAAKIRSFGFGCHFRRNVHLHYAYSRCCVEQ